MSSGQNSVPVALLLVVAMINLPKSCHTIALAVERHRELRPADTTPIPIGPGKKVDYTPPNYIYRPPSWRYWDKNEGPACSAVPAQEVASQGITVSASQMSVEPDRAPPLDETDRGRS